MSVHHTVAQKLLSDIACHTYLVVLEAGGLGEAVELGLVGVAEAGLDAGQNREKS